MGSNVKIAVCCTLLAATIIIAITQLTGSKLAIIPVVCVAIFAFIVWQREEEALEFEEERITSLYRKRLIHNLVDSICTPDIDACNAILKDKGVPSKQRLLEAQAYMIEKGYDTELANTPVSFELYVKRIIPISQIGEYFALREYFELKDVVFSHKLSMPIDQS